MQVAYLSPGKSCYMAFTIKGQTKAAVAFKGKFGIYEPILFKLCVEVAYWHSLMFCYMAFTIKGQTKAAVAFKGRFSVCRPILIFLAISYLYTNFEQNRSIKAKFTFKGQCGLCLAIDCKGHATKHQ